MATAIKKQAAAIVDISNLTSVSKTERLNQTLAVFTTAWGYIDTPEKWCKGAMARRKSRHEVEVRSASAVKFCSYGAVERGLAADDKFKGLDYTNLNPRSLLNTAVGMLAIPRSKYSTGSVYHSAVEFNDERATTHADIERMFAMAVAIIIDTAERHNVVLD